MTSNLTKSFKHSLIAASMVLAGTSMLAATPVAAQAIKGIAVANPNAVVAQSNAFKVAEQQRPVTYKPQIDQANARKTAIEAQLRPLATKLETDARAASPNQTALQTQYNQIQQLEQAGQQEINQILQPIALSRAYVLEQIGDKLEAATKAAMAKQKITLLFDSQAVILPPEPAYNLDQAILNELNTAFPAAQLVPPAGWLPRQQREQQAAAAAAQGQRPAQTPPATPQGR